MKRDNEVVSDPPASWLWEQMDWDFLLVVLCRSNGQAGSSEEAHRGRDISWIEWSGSFGPSTKCAKSISQVVTDQKKHIMGKMDILITLILILIHSRFVLTGSWPNCALAGCESRSHEVLCQSSHYQCRKWNIWSDGRR